MADVGRIGDAGGAPAILMACVASLAAQRDPCAVVGSITAATGVIRLAGKPDLAACSRISASLGAL